MSPGSGAPRLEGVATALRSTNAQRWWGTRPRLLSSPPCQFPCCQLNDTPMRALVRSGRARTRGQALRTRRLEGRLSSRSVLQQSSTQGLVQRHEILQAREPHGLQLLLSAIERALRIERAQVAVNAPPVAHVGQPICLLRCRHESLLSRELLIERATGDQRIGDLTEGGLNRLLVLRDRGIASELGRLEVGNVGTARKDRDTDLRGEGPGARTAFEQA